MEGFLELALAADRWENHRLIPIASQVDQIFGNFSAYCESWYVKPRVYRNDFLFGDVTHKGTRNFILDCPGNSMLALARGQICSGLPVSGYYPDCCLIVPGHGLDAFANLSPALASRISDLACISPWTWNFQVLLDEGIVGGSHQSFVDRVNLRAELIDRKHRDMLPETAAALRDKYAVPSQPLPSDCPVSSLFGRISMWSVIEKLALTFDLSDSAISVSTSQFVHCMQVFEGMLANNVSDEWKLLVALLHDIGKTLSLTGELDENVDGSNLVLSCPREGSGLSSCLLTYSHDEFGYEKLRHILPVDMANREKILYAVRFHSIHTVNDKWLDDEDRKMFDWLFKEFQLYDQGTKNPANVPNLQVIGRARALIEKWFPFDVCF